MTAAGAVARWMGRVVVAACLAAGAVTPPPPASSDAASVDEAVVRSEVRLRKLHLVRPDLIPYPIAYEVCC